jgi:hypothetical protein
MLLLSRKNAKAPRIYRILFFIGVMSGIVFPACAERKYFVGTTFDAVGGISNQLGQTGFTLAETAPFFSVYPSIDLKSVGEHSKLDLDYTFSLSRFYSSTNITTTSHVATGGFTAQLGAKTHLRVSDTFDTMPNYSTINVLKGFTITPQGFQYVFEPQLNKNFSKGDSGNIGLDVDLTPKSFLTFAGSASYRHYDSTVSHSYFPDQLRVEGSLEFSHKHSTRTIWSLKYKAWQNDYEDNFPTTRSHAATLGLSRVLSPGLNLTLEAGPAYVETASYVSYVVNANISKQLKTSRFDAGYSHNAGDSTGIGGASESHQGRLGFLQPLGRTTSISFQASAFRQSQMETGAYSYWGASGSAGLAQKLGEYFVTSIGASYTTNIGNSVNNYLYKSAYVSVGYRLPDFWRIER